MAAVSGARLLWKAARTAVSATAKSSFRRCYGGLFASGNALFGLSKLSVWWLRLGIAIERIRPGHLQQQARFDDFVSEFNEEQPHEALGMRPPKEVYTPSERPYRGLPELDYSFHDKDILVTSCGRICIGKRKINLSTVFAG